MSAAPVTRTRVILNDHSASRGTLEKLRTQKELPLTWAKPGEVADQVLLRAHTAEHLARLSEQSDFDNDTPFFPQIETYARSSVAAALMGMEAARAGELAFSLMRPPGHHATRNRAMGFCFLNNSPSPPAMRWSARPEACRGIRFRRAPRQRHRRHPPEPTRRVLFFYSSISVLSGHRHAQCGEQLFQLSCGPANAPH